MKLETCDLRLPIGIFGINTPIAKSAAYSAEPSAELANTAPLPDLKLLPLPPDLPYD